MSAVAPQLIDTPANRAFVPADIPGHAVSSEAIAAVIAFLVSDAAALVSEAIIRAYGTRPTARPCHRQAQQCSPAQWQRRAGTSTFMLSVEDRCCGTPVTRITRIR